MLMDDEDDEDNITTLIWLSLTTVQSSQTRITVTIAQPGVFIILLRKGLHWTGMSNSEQFGTNKAMALQRLLKWWRRTMQTYWRSTNSMVLDLNHPISTVLKWNPKSGSTMSSHCEVTLGWQYMITFQRVWVIFTSMAVWRVFLLAPWILW
jgi:hypothetical protein